MSSSGGGGGGDGKPPPRYRCGRGWHAGEVGLMKVGFMKVGLMRMDGLVVWWICRRRYRHG